MIAEDKIAEVRDAARISDFISPYVTLRQGGRSLMGLCPFHSEKSGSFSVNDENGFFHCFGCGVGGNVFKFLMMIENLTFPEAVRKVAATCGIDLPETGSPRENSERDQLFAVAASATRYFRRCLQETPPGLEIASYLEGRGVSSESCEHFQLGASPPSGDGLVRWFRRENVELGLAERLGLLGRQGERYYDKFRGRLMFPIRDAQGRVAGFGGRAVADGDGPKYLNTSDSAVYKKSRILYGLFESREARRGLRPDERDDSLVLVEGYLDVISLHQAGAVGAVATCGTALTADQAGLMKRHGGEVTALFDGDDPGRAAAARSFTVFVEAGMWPRGAFLSDGEDPDSLVREGGREALNRALEGAAPLAEPWVRSLSGTGDAAGQRARIGAELSRVLGKVDDPFERDFLLKKASLWTDISEDVLRGQLRSLAQRGERRGPYRPPAPSDDSREMPSDDAVETKPVRKLPAASRGAPSSEEWIVTLIVADQECVARVLGTEDIEAALTDEPWATILREYLASTRSDAVIELPSLLDLLPDDAQSRVSARLIEDASLADGGTRDRILVDALARLTRKVAKQDTHRRLADMRRREELGEELDTGEELSRWRTRDPDA